MVNIVGDKHRGFTSQILTADLRCREFQAIAAAVGHLQTPADSAAAPAIAWTWSKWTWKRIAKKKSKLELLNKPLPWVRVEESWNRSGFDPFGRWWRPMFPNAATLTSENKNNQRKPLFWVWHIRTTRRCQVDLAINSSRIGMHIMIVRALINFWTVNQRLLRQNQSFKFVLGY